MKPFALENVLKHRQRLEDLAQNKFIQAKEIADTIRKRYVTKQKELQKLIKTIETKQQLGIDITMLIWYQDQINQEGENLSAIKKNLKEKERLVEQMLQNLLTKTQERQVMEQLKVEQNKAWRKHLEKKEAMMLDKIAVMRHGKEI